MILSALYDGNICPAEDAVSGDSEYRRLNEKIVKALNALESKLTPEQMVLVNDLHGRLNDLNCCESKAKFIFGFKMGVQVMQEVNEFSLMTEK